MADSPLESVDRDRLETLCRRFGIAELAVFGSAARGGLRQDSDLDVLYSLQPGVRLGWEIEEFAEELSNLFGRPVDLVSRRAINARIRDAVLSEARPPYAA